jgi:hypothetical protein
MEPPVKAGTVKATTETHGSLNYLSDSVSWISVDVAHLKVTLRRSALERVGTVPIEGSEGQVEIVP